VKPARPAPQTLSPTPSNPPAPQFAKYWGAPTLTRMKTHLGTAVYMSPELIENRQTHAQYDPVEVDVSPRLPCALAWGPSVGGVFGMGPWWSLSHRTYLPSCNPTCAHCSFEF
jgi:hypothetical protein